VEPAAPPGSSERKISPKPGAPEFGREALACLNRGQNLGFPGAAFALSIPAMLVQGDLNLALGQNFSQP
jgi:hypothetical protein